MEWLIGSAEVDLSPAERAIHQLSEDKDAIEEKLKALQEESSKQQYVLYCSDVEYFASACNSHLAGSIFRSLPMQSKKLKLMKSGTI